MLLGRGNTSHRSNQQMHTNISRVIGSLTCEVSFIGQILPSEQSSSRMSKRKQVGQRGRDRGEPMGF